jgi:predicted aminopeptidase
VPLDNASLLARRVYAKDLGLFDLIYQRENKNLRATIARLIQLAKSDRDDPYRALRRFVDPGIAKN